MGSRYLTLTMVPVAAAFLSLLYFSYSPYSFPYPGCALHELTGYFCPACGSQRAFADLLHGRIKDAVHNNLLFILGLPLLLYAYVRWTRATILKDRVSFLPASATTWWLVLAAVMIFWILRNLPLFSFLAPVSY